MADTGSEFIEYLKAYDVEAFNKVSADSATDALINSVIAKHKDKFEVWQKVPEWLRDKYNNRVPENILDMAKSGVPLTQENINTATGNSDSAKSALQPADFNPSLELATAVVFTAADIAAIKYMSEQIALKGYGPEASDKLAASKQIRHKLAEQLQDTSVKAKGQISADWRKTRESDFKTIKQDWIRNQPEKMFVHLVKEMHRGKIDAQTAIPQLDVLLNKVNEQGRQQQLVTALQEPQSMAKHYSESTKSMLAEMLQSHNIGGQRANAPVTKQTAQVNTANPDRSDNLILQSRLQNIKSGR